MIEAGFEWVLSSWGEGEKTSKKVLDKSERK
jgi:hypothetical protein